MDAFNEVKLLLIMYHLCLFTTFVPDPETKHEIGFSCLTILFIGLAFNMIMMFVAPVVLIKRYCKLRYHKKKAKKELENRKPYFLVKEFRQRCKKKQERYEKFKRNLANMIIELKEEQKKEDSKAIESARLPQEQRIRLESEQSNERLQHEAEQEQKPEASK